MLWMGTAPYLQVCCLFPDNDQMTFSEVVRLPALYFINTFKVPMLAPNIWYQNLKQRFAVVRGNLSLIKRALSPCFRGADDSIYAYVPKKATDTC